MLPPPPKYTAGSKLKHMKKTVRHVSNHLPYIKYSKLYNGFKSVPRKKDTLKKKKNQTLIIIIIIIYMYIYFNPLIESTKVDKRVASEMF